MNPDRKRNYKLFVWLILVSFAFVACTGTSAQTTPTPTITTTAVETPTDPPEQTPATPTLAIPESTTTASPPAQRTGRELQSEALLPEAAQNLPDLFGATEYDLDVDINFAKQSFLGSALVHYTNTENVALESIYFRLLPNGDASYGNGSLSVADLHVDGQPVETELSKGGVILEAPLPTALQPGEQLDITFEFQGTVPVDFGRSGYGIYNFSDNVMALSGWFPILAVYDDEGWNLDTVSAIGDSVYADIAFYTVDITVASEVEIAATGVPVERQVDGDTAQYRFVSGPVRDFFITLSPDFQAEQRTVNGITIKSYFLPGHENGAQKALDISVASLEIFNQRFGQYPYTELDVIDAPMRYAAGVEFPGVILIGSFLYDDPQRPTFTIATAHEVAHQWWYNVVGNDVFDEPWLDEALTTYSSSLYYQFEVGPQAYAGLINNWQERYDQIVLEGEDYAITRSLDFFENLAEPGLYGGIVYTKGALFFYNLRQEIGDEAFFDALQRYYQQNQYGIGTPEELLNSFETAAGRQLDDFYQEWLYAPE